MVVDKARRDGAPLGVDRAFGRAAQFAELDDLAILDPDIAVKRRHPRAVDDAPVFDQEVIRHRFPFLRSGHQTAVCGKKFSTAAEPLRCKMRQPVQPSVPARTAKAAKYPDRTGKFPQRFPLRGRSDRYKFRLIKDLRYL